jgi:hypothetical protein
MGASGMTMPWTSNGADYATMMTWELGGCISANDEY